MADTAWRRGCRILAGAIIVMLGPAAEALEGGPHEAPVEQPASLEPLVTVATRYSRPLREVAGNVTVISRDALDETLSVSLADAVRYAPGLDAAGGGSRFGTEGLIVRGLGGNRVAMELDGIPLSQHFSIGNFSNATRDLVDVGVLEQIEVLRGPASSLYGSSALGGVVSMRTPDPGTLGPAGQAFRIQQGARTRDDSLHLVAGGDWTSGSAGALVLGTRRSGHETEASAGGNNDRLDRTTGSGLVKIVSGAGNGRAQLSGLYYGHRAAVDSDNRALTGSGRFSRTSSLAGDDEYELDVVGGEYRTGPMDGIGEAAFRAWFERARFRQDTVDERAHAERPVRIDRRFRYRQDTRGLSVDLNQLFESGAIAHRLALGGEWTTSRIDERRNGREAGLDDPGVTTIVLGEAFPVRDFPVSDVGEAGFYVHDEMNAGRISVIAGLRYDRYTLDPDSDPIYREDNPAVSAVDVDASEWSPRLGVIVPVGGGLDLWAQYAHGFRAPPFADANIGLDIPMFNLRAIPNPELDAETSDGVEAGLRLRSPTVRMDLTAFYTAYDDFIESKVRLGVDPASGRLLFQSRNVSEAHVYGAEFDSELDLDGWWPGMSLNMAAFWARGRDEDDGEPLNSVGPPQAVVAATWASPGGISRVTLAGTFTSRHKRLNESRGPLFETPGYAVFDLMVCHRLGRHLQLRGGIENLLDRTYWRWSDVRGLGPDDPTISTRSQPGRSLAVDMKWLF